MDGQCPQTASPARLHIYLTGLQVSQSSPGRTVKIQVTVLWTAGPCRALQKKLTAASAISHDLLPQSLRGTWICMQASQVTWICMQVWQVTCRCLQTVGKPSGDCRSARPVGDTVHGWVSGVEASVHYLGAEPFETGSIWTSVLGDSGCWWFGDIWWLAVIRWFR
jgi:hypothetical protein